MNRREFIFASAASTLVISGGCSASPPSRTAVIAAPAGKLQGHVIDGVQRFLGVPYAQPPFGERRWRAPLRRPQWSGVLQATDYGQICPQTGGMLSKSLR